MTGILADVYISPIQQFIGTLVFSHFVFPFVFIEAVTSGYAEQMFYRDVLPNRSDRLVKTLRANCGAAVICVLLSLLGGLLEPILHTVSRSIPDSLETVFWLLMGASLFAVPVSIEALFWNRWSRRKLWGRVLAANFVSGAVCFAAVVFVRWLREHLPQTLEWKLRRFHGDVFCI